MAGNGQKEKEKDKAKRNVRIAYGLFYQRRMVAAANKRRIKK